MVEKSLITGEDQLCKFPLACSCGMEHPSYVHMYVSKYVHNCTYLDVFTRASRSVTVVAYLNTGETEVSVCGTSSKRRR